VQLIYLSHDSYILNNSPSLHSLSNQIAIHMTTPRIISMIGWLRSCSVSIYGEKDHVAVKKKKKKKKKVSPAMEMRMWK